MTADFLLAWIFTTAIILFTWIIPVAVVLTAVALLFAFIGEGFSTLFGRSKRKPPAFWEDTGPQMEEFYRYIDELFAKFDPVDNPFGSSVG